MQKGPGQGPLPGGLIWLMHQTPGDHEEFQKAQKSLKNASRENFGGQKRNYTLKFIITRMNIAF